MKIFLYLKSPYKILKRYFVLCINFSAKLNFEIFIKAAYYKKINIVSLEPVNGNWSDWGPFGDCSVTCGSGSKTRARTCTNPAPQHNGECVGNDVETAACNEQPCPGLFIMNCVFYKNKKNLLRLDPLEVEKKYKG